MPLIPCPEPECDNRVSTDADSCPSCGCKINIVDQDPATGACKEADATVDPIFEARDELVRSLGICENRKHMSRAYLTDDTVYKNSCVMVREVDVLEDLFENCGEWVNEIQLSSTDVRKNFRERDLVQLSRFPDLRKLDLGNVNKDDFDDDYIYVVSQMASLRFLRLPTDLPECSKSGLLQLESLQNLLVLGFPYRVGEQEEAWMFETKDRAKKIRKKLRKRMPNTQVLDSNDISCEPWYAMSESSF